MMLNGVYSLIILVIVFSRDDNEWYFFDIYVYLGLVFEVWIQDIEVKLDNEVGDIVYYVLIEVWYVYLLLDMYII